MVPPPSGPPPKSRERPSGPGDKSRSGSSSNRPGGDHKTPSRSRKETAVPSSARPSPGGARPASSGSGGPSSKHSRSSGPPPTEGGGGGSSSNARRTPSQNKKEAVVPSSSSKHNRNGSAAPPASGGEGERAASRHRRSSSSSDRPEGADNKRDDKNGQSNLRRSRSGKDEKDKQDGQDDEADKDCTASEFREKGNAAFKHQKWGDAIRYYTKALRLDNRHFTCYSNRSAAFLKKNKVQEALQDANACVRLKPEYHKGHLRRGAALFEMKRYNDAIKAYEQGLKHCPGDKELIKSIETAKQARMTNSKASAASRKVAAATEAAKSRNKKATGAKSVSSFVKETKANLELQMAKITSQLDLLQELENMTQEEKLDLLYTLLDKDGDGCLDANELAVGMRKRNVDMSFSESIQKAIDLVAMFDDDGDARLDRDEFENFVEKMLEELKTTFDEFAEFLVFQILFSEDDPEEEVEKIEKEKLDEQVKERGTMLEMLSDPRMMSIFMLFDKDGDCSVDFKEVAMGLYQLTNSMEESAKATMQLLLMMETDDDRVIGYEQFAKLIMAIVAAADSTFDEVADDLTHALTSNKKISTEAMEELFVADKIYKDRRSKEREEKQQAKIMDALSYGRTQRLFSLWDENGDGTIDVTELMTGLERYQKAVGNKSDVKEIAKQLLQMADGKTLEEINNDKASGKESKMSTKDIMKRELSPEEFALAMVNYSEIIKSNLHELIDFMCVVTALGDGSDNYEKAYTQAAQHGAIKKPKTLKGIAKLDECDVD